MKPFRERKILMVAFLGSILVAGLSSQDGYAQNTKKVDQLNFQLPEDWPVEKRGGLVTPMPTEEYVLMRFKQVQEEFESIRDEFSKNFTGLQEKLRGIEKDLSKQSMKSQSPEDALSKTAGIVSDIELLKSELGRLERKITNKMLKTQGDLEKVHARVTSMEENLENIQTQVYKLQEKVDYLRDNQLSSY